MSRCEMFGVFGTPFSDEDVDRIKQKIEGDDDVVHVAFTQYADGEYRFLVTFVEGANEPTNQATL